MNKFDEFVNETARISFYGDFLYPLATDSTWEDYKKEIIVEKYGITL